jgi:hypothetical protein
VGRAWDSVDNRLGQLVYDNLFWHNMTKDLGLVATRSLGWNLGTIRELAGGVADYARALKAFLRSPEEQAELERHWRRQPIRKKHRREAREAE